MIIENYPDSSFRKVNIKNHVSGIFTKLSVIPDLHALVSFYLVIPLILILKIKRSAPTDQNFISHISSKISGEGLERLSVLFFLIPLMFMGFIVATPLSGKFFIPLIRYYLWVTPLMYIGMIFYLKTHISSYFINKNTGTIVSSLTTFIITVGLSVFFSLNRFGNYYPSLYENKKSFSAVERSFEYLDLFYIQKDSVKSIEALSDEIPIFVTLGEYYYLSSPTMGYTTKNIKNLYLVYENLLQTASLRDYPNVFILLDSETNNLHGQKQVDNLLDEAQSNPQYSVTELVNHHNLNYSSSIYRISRL